MHEGRGDVGIGKAGGDVGNEGSAALLLEGVEGGLDAAHGVAMALGGVGFAPGLEGGCTGRGLCVT